MTSSPPACRVADCTVKSPRHRWYLDWTRRAQVNLPWPPPHTASVSSFLSRADPRQQRDTRSAAASEGRSALLCGHQRARLQPWRRYCGGSIAPPAHMGLLLSKEEARLHELDTLVDEAWEQYSGLHTAAAAEIAAGIPPVAGTNQALRAAAHMYYTQLTKEWHGLYNRHSASCPPQLAGQLACCGGHGMFARLQGAVGREHCFRRRRLRGEAPTTSWPAWAGCSAAPVRSPARRLAGLLTRLPPGLHPLAPCLVLPPAAVALRKGEVDVPPMPHHTPPLQLMAVALAG